MRESSFPVHNRKWLFSRRDMSDLVKLIRDEAECYDAMAKVCRDVADNSESLYARQQALKASAGFVQ